MTLIEKICQAFAGREMPERVSDHTYIDCDVEDALWFAGKKWQEATWEDWKHHTSAMTFFNKQAFAYYLPSLLILTLQHPNESLLVVDSVLGTLDTLDRSPSKEGWNDLFIEHFVGLRNEEYEVLKEWLLAICEYPAFREHGIRSGPGDPWHERSRRLLFFRKPRHLDRSVRIAFWAVVPFPSRTGSIYLPIADRTTITTTQIRIPREQIILMLKPHARPNPIVS